MVKWGSKGINYIKNVCMNMVSNVTAENNVKLINTKQIK